MNFAYLAGFMFRTRHGHGPSLTAIKVHIRGTVEKISADSVVVKQADGKSVKVKIRRIDCLSIRGPNNEE